MPLSPKLSAFKRHKGVQRTLLRSHGAGSAATWPGCTVTLPYSNLFVCVCTGARGGVESGFASNQFVGRRGQRGAPATGTHTQDRARAWAHPREERRLTQRAANIHVCVFVCMWQHNYNYVCVCVCVCVCIHTHSLGTSALPLSPPPSLSLNINAPKNFPDPRFPRVIPQRC